MTETIRMIEAYSRNHHYHSINSENYIFALDTAEVENNSKMFTSRIRVI